LTSKETDRFLVRTPNGDELEVFETTDLHRYHGNKGAGSAPGNKRLRTSDGEPVNYVAPGRYALIDGTPLVRI
jgi:hypothetical protein